MRSGGAGAGNGAARPPLRSREERGRGGRRRCAPVVEEGQREREEVGRKAVTGGLGARPAREPGLRRGASGWAEVSREPPGIKCRREVPPRRRDADLAASLPSQGRAVGLGAKRRSRSCPGRARLLRGGLRPFGGSGGGPTRSGSRGWSELLV